MYTYIWESINGSWQWVKTPYEIYVEQGWWGHVWTYGPERYRKGATDVSASGTGYHWSFYTTSDSTCTMCRDTNTGPPWCEFCPVTNF